MVNPLLKVIFLAGAATFCHAFAPRGFTPPAVERASTQNIASTNWASPRVTRSSIVGMMSPVDATNLVLADKDYGLLAKNVAIVLALGGGLIPATISANQAMFKTLAGNSVKEDEDGEVKPGESLDPTIGQTSFRKYVEDSGATGQDLPFSSLLFSADRIPLADIVAVLGRIESADKLVDWKNLPSTKLPNVSVDPPMWLPRKAFKVLIRQAKFLGWPTDPKTGKPVGGEELKEAELSRVSKKGALISDAALDAVFDSWSWGANIATPDKVQTTLNIFKPSPTEVDIGEFIGSAIRGRSTTGFAALTFIVIQLMAYGVIFVQPALRFFFDIELDFSL